MMSQFNGLTMARVVAFHPLDNSCDCQLVYDGSRLTGVPMLNASMTTSSGHVDWHAPEGSAWDAAPSKTRDVMAILGSVSDQPIVIGFLAAPVSQMLFDRKNFKVDRHASDVYSTTDDYGNVTFAHPSGTYACLTTGSQKEDLTGMDYDKIWKITRNLTKQVSLIFKMARLQQCLNALLTKWGAKLKIDPSGLTKFDTRSNIGINLTQPKPDGRTVNNPEQDLLDTFTSSITMVNDGSADNGNVTLKTVGKVTVNIVDAANKQKTLLEMENNGKCTLTATGDVTLKTVDSTGAETTSVMSYADGHVRVKANIWVSLEAPSIFMVGNVSVTGALIDNAVNVGSTHKHRDVTAGAAQTGVPV